MYICLCVSKRTWVQVPMAFGGGCWITWSWIYRWPAWSGCWELNSCCSTSSHWLLDPPERFPSEYFFILSLYEEEQCILNSWDIFPVHLLRVLILHVVICIFPLLACKNTFDTLLWCLDVLYEPIMMWDFPLYAMNSGFAHRQGALSLGNSHPL